MTNKMKLIKFNTIQYILIFDSPIAGIPVVEVLSGESNRLCLQNEPSGADSLIRLGILAKLVNNLK